MLVIKKKLDRMAADSRLLPKTEKYEAVHYMLNEWGTLPPRTPLSKYRELLPDKWKRKNIAQE